MKNTSLITNWFGSFLVKEGKIIDERLFPKDPESIAQRRILISEGKILEEEKELALEVGEGLKVTSERLSPLGEMISTEVNLPSPEERSYSMDLLQKALIIEGREGIRRSVDVDKHLAKAVGSIKDLNETVNILTERLRDWYSLHYPELFDEGEDELEMIKECGDRESIEKATGKRIDSVGSPMAEKERELLRALSHKIIELRDYRDELKDYVENTMDEIAPSITFLTGPRLGGELIAHAGSLKKLAMMPASTIQVLGAEKSLFRHLEKGTPPPKHGYILQHPIVHRSAPEVRGKVARALANKIAIAARVDYFGEENKGKEIKDNLEQRLEAITGN